jgi:hypothetical protein
LEKERKKVLYKKSNAAGAGTEKSDKLSANKKELEH